MAALTAIDVASRVRDIPPLPAVVTEVLRATKDPTTSVPSLASTLARDQALTSKVLRMANSALFGFPRRIGVLSEAIVLLGFTTVRSLALAGSAFALMDRALDGYGLSRGALWEQGMAAGVAARHIAKRARSRKVEEAFIGGLLHDLGKLVLDSQVGDQYPDILALVRRGGVTFAEAERAVLGIDHCDVGAQVAEIWGLPEELASTLRYYLKPSEDPANLELPCIVHLGYVAAVSAGIGLGADGLACPVDPHAFARLGVGPEIVEEAAALLPEAFLDGDRLLRL